MRNVRWPIPTAMVLASAAVAAAQETPKAQPAQGGNPTVEFKTVTKPVAVQEARDPKIAETKAVVEEHMATVNAAFQDVSVLSELVKLRDAASNDPHREVMLRLKAAATESCTQCHTGGVSVKKDEGLGLTLVPADETLRSQLKLGKKGLVVTAVAPGSPAGEGGVKEKDILVEIAGKAMDDLDSFRTALGKVETAGGVTPGDPKAIRPVPIALQVLRAGQPKEVLVPPPSPPMLIVGRLANDPGQPPRYWIGVTLGELDDTLRTHLRLEDNTGVVLTDVIGDSPAARAGLKKDDILLSIDGTPLKAPEEMVKLVQAAKDEKTIKLQLRRAGDPIDVSVRPEKRKDAGSAEAAKTFEFQLARVANTQQQNWIAQVVPLLEAKANPTYAITAPAPGSPVQYYTLNTTLPIQAWVAGQPGAAYPNPNPDAALQVEAQRKKTVESEQKALQDAVLADLNAQVRRINARLPDQAEWMTAVESLKKSAPTAQSLAKIDAQLKALEAQVGDIKRSMEELKGAVKREK